MQIEEFITESVFFKHLSDTTTQVVSGESKQNYGEKNGYLNLPSVPTSKNKRQFRLKDLDCFMLISCINSLKEILSSKRYKSITNFPSSHNKKSGYFKRDNLVVSIIENKKDQTILSITDYLILFSNSLYEDCICPLFSTGSSLSNPLIFLHLEYM